MAVNGVLNMIDYYLNPLVSLCRYEQLIGGKETLRRKASELGLPLWVGGESTGSPSDTGCGSSRTTQPPGSTAKHRAPAQSPASAEPALWSPKTPLTDTVAQSKEDWRGVVLLAPSTFHSLLGHTPPLT